MSHTPCLMGGFDSNDAGSQPFNGLARNGRSLRFTPRKIRRTRITRLKPCACSPPYVHKFNININTGDGGRRSISTGFALEILRLLHPSNREIKDFGFVVGFSPSHRGFSPLKQQLPWGEKYGERGIRTLDADNST